MKLLANELFTFFACIGVKVDDIKCRNCISNKGY